MMKIHDPLYYVTPEAKFSFVLPINIFITACLQALDFFLRRISVKKTLLYIIE